MGVIVQEDREQVQVYRLVEGPLADQTFYGTHRIVCTDPTCPSTDMILTLRRHNDEQASPRSKETYEIVIDAKNRTLSRERVSSEIANDIRFAEAFVSHLSQAHWNVFYRDLLQQRRALLDDATTLESAHFDFTDLEYTIEHESAMVFFDTVFPFGRPLDLEVRGTRVTLIDQYCLNSRCTCTNVVLSALPAFGSAEQTDDTSIKPLFTVSHDYRTHTATMLNDFVAGSNGAAPGRDADLFLRAPKADLKRISTLVKKRHRMMRSVYEAYRKRTGAGGCSHRGDLADNVTPPDPLRQPSGNARVIEDNPPRGKVGRNQPCPCGSGRKYKHCCGR